MKYYLLVFVTVFLLSSAIFSIVISYAGLNYNYVISWLRISSVAFAVIFFIFYYKRRNGELFGEIDRNIYLLMSAFLDIKKISDEKKLNILKQTFSSYSEKQTEKLFSEYKNKTPDIKDICRKLRKTGGKVKIFILYSLFNLASYDGVLNKKEDNFILNISKLLNIPKQTYEAVKKLYIKKGLIDEEELKRKQAYQKSVKNSSSFLFPYEAYRIMGVSPSVTKSQLKRAYRNLAKKHHPDKFAGESKEVLKNAEEKFQEIKEAYDTIKKSKNI
ncbi:MAG: DnaJ domain-containing protein [Bacteroidales bacterium]|nr:DnaJ domain-containing protein [Bacteroidales bacterium]